jgi:Ferredoxin
MDLRNVSIDEGCIACNLCEDLVPQVFQVPAGGNCTVRTDWRAQIEAQPDLEEVVREAASCCPVEVIRLEG